MMLYIIFKAITLLSSIIIYLIYCVSVAIFSLSVRRRCFSADCAVVVELEWHCSSNPSWLTLGFMTTAAVALPCLPLRSAKGGMATCRV